MVAALGEGRKAYMDMHKAGPAPVDLEGSSMYSSTTPAWRSMIVPLVLCVCVWDVVMPKCRPIEGLAAQPCRKHGMADKREMLNSQNNEQRVLYYIVANRD